MPKMRFSRHHQDPDAYFDHCCTIGDSKDVLQTDIPGLNVCNRLQRWWCGLFLLHYNDERCTTYFKSLNAMKMDRTQHFRKFRHRIHPLSKFRSSWNVAIFIVFLMEWICFHHNASLTFGHISPYFYYVGAATDVIIFIDIIVNMMTGFIDTEQNVIVLDMQQGLLHYGSRKLFLHVAAAIPLHGIIILRYGTDLDCTVCKMNKFIATLNFLSTFRLFRLSDTSRCMTRERSNYKLTYFLRFTRVYILGTFTMMHFIKISNCLELLHTMSVGKINEKHYLYMYINRKYVESDVPLPSNFTFLIVEYIRVGLTLIFYHFRSGITQYYLDKFATLVGVVIIFMFYYNILLEFYTFISRKNFVDEMLVVKQKATENLINSHQLPESMVRKTRKYFQYNQAKMRVIEKHNNLLCALPDSLKKDIFKATYLRLITRVPCFSEWPIVLLEDILELMREDIYLKDDMVAEPGVPSEGLIVVATGELAVYSQDGQESRHLIDGDSFGELCLVTDNELRVATVVALSPCVIIILDKMSFRRYMRHRPGLFHLMKKELTRKYSNKARNGNSTTMSVITLPS